MHIARCRLTDEKDMTYDDYSDQVSAKAGATHASGLSLGHTKNSKHDFLIDKRGDEDMRIRRS